MKILAFILALYIVLLPALPCVDRDGAMQAYETNMGTASHQENPHSDEMCSPFCICSCCGHTINSNTFFEKHSTEKVFISLVNIASYNSVILSSGHFGNIWQPPRLG